MCPPPPFPRAKRAPARTAPTDRCYSAGWSFAESRHHPDASGYLGSGSGRGNHTSPRHLPSRVPTNRHSALFWVAESVGHVRASQSHASEGSGHHTAEKPAERHCRPWPRVVMPTSGRGLVVVPPLSSPSLPSPSAWREAPAGKVLLPQPPPSPPSPPPASLEVRALEGFGSTGALSDLVRSIVSGQIQVSGDADEWDEGVSQLTGTIGRAGPGSGSGALGRGPGSGAGGPRRSARSCSPAATC